MKLNKPDIECVKNKDGDCCINGFEIDTCPLFKLKNGIFIDDSKVSVEFLCNCGNRYVSGLTTIKTKCNKCKKVVEHKVLEHQEKRLCYEITKKINHSECIYLFSEGLDRLNHIKVFGDKYMSHLRFDPPETYHLITDKDKCIMCGFCKECKTHVDDIENKDGHLFCKDCGNEIIPTMFKRTNKKECPKCKNKKLEQCYKKIKGMRIEER